MLAWVDSDVDVAYLVEVSGSTSTSGCILRWFGWVVSWTRVGGELGSGGSRVGSGGWWVEFGWVVGWFECVVGWVRVGGELGSKVFQFDFQLQIPVRFPEFPDFQLQIPEFQISRFPVANSSCILSGGGWGGVGV